MEGEKSQFVAPQASPVYVGNTYAQPAYGAQPTTYVQPVNYGVPTAAPQQVYVQQVGHAGVEVRRPAPYKWSDSICDWPKNLFPSCYCVCCFFSGIYLTAQSMLK